MAGRFTFYSYDLLTYTLLAELPYTNVTFSQRLNVAGSFSGDLLLSDPRVRNLGAVAATNESKTLTIIDLDGQIVWGGINWTRAYDSTTRVATIGGQEAWSYFSRRVQAADYSSPPAGPYWSSNPADACTIAQQVIYDAIKVYGSAFQAMPINVVETVPNPNTITGTYPSTQRQTVQSIVSTLSGGGYGTGFDFGIDWAWSNGQGSYPLPTLTISYPRRGKAFGATSPAILMTGGNASTGYTWPGDGSKQANSIYGTASGSGGLQYSTGADATVLGAGYPLLEMTSSFANVTATSQLAASAQGDWAQFEWPVVTPTFSMPAIGDPSLGTFTLGDDERVVISPDERFPSGIDTALRVVAVDVTVAESGLSTMTHTMNVPPGLAPTPAPPN